MLKQDFLKLIESREIVTTVDAFGHSEGTGYVMHVWDNNRVQLYMLDGEHARRLIELPYNKVQRIESVTDK